MFCWLFVFLCVGTEKKTFNIFLSKNYPRESQEPLKNWTQTPPRVKHHETHQKFFNYHFLRFNFLRSFENRLTNWKMIWPLRLVYYTSSYEHPVGLRLKYLIFAKSANSFPEIYHLIAADFNFCLAVNIDFLIFERSSLYCVKNGQKEECCRRLYSDLFL